MSGHTCRDLLNAIRRCNTVIIPADNPMCVMNVKIDKKDLEKEIMHMCQGNLKLPSGFWVNTRQQGRKNIAVLKSARLA